MGPADRRAVRVPMPSDGWRSHAGLRKQLPSLLVFLLGVGLTGLLVALTHVRNREGHRVEFERLANRTTSELRTKLELPLEVLQSIASLFDASDEVTRRDFHLFVKKALERHPGTRALEWIPIVPAAERQRYEARARADGMTTFEFKEEGSNLSLVTARPRVEYMPIYYMEPPDPTALGFDVAANPFRRAPADRARETGSAVASERIRLVEDPPTVYSVAVFYPVRGHVAGQPVGEICGFAAEVFRVHAIVEPIVRDVVGQGIDVVLQDTAASAERGLLFESSPNVLGRSRSPGGERYTVNLPFAHRSWSLTFSTERTLSHLPWATLFTGLAVSALFALMLSASTLIYRLRRQVHAALQLGQYVLVEELGEGGMGVVYRARHTMLRRPTAIKLLRPDRQDAQDISRFEREVQLTSRLSHPNTIAVYDYGRTPEGIFYYAMEFIDGVTLQDLVDSDGPMPIARAVRILIQVCGALAEAHAAGIVHRDVKPANLMVMERGGIPDFVKVLDFGLVKQTAAEGSPFASRGTPLLGTPLYLSPEAISSGVVDARADLYSLGAVAYFLISGVTVFEGENLVEICAEHLYTAPVAPSLRTKAPVPASVDALILRCLEKNPDERPASAVALQVALRAIEAEVGAFSDDDARAWWQARGRALVAERRARRHKAVLDPVAASVTVAVDSEWERRQEKTPL